MAPAAPEVVRERQEAVADVAPRLAWRQELEAHGRIAAGERRDPEPLLAWAEGPRWVGNRPWLRVLLSATALNSPWASFELQGLGRVVLELDPVSTGGLP